MVNPGAVITTLDDLSVVKLDFSVPEAVPLDAAAGLDGPGAQHGVLRTRRSTARVASVDTRVDPTTRSVAIRALIDNRDGRLRPGMFMTVKLVRAGRRMH